MSSQCLVDKSPPAEATVPGGLAIFCFIVGAPHLYGRIRSHHGHPQTRWPVVRSGRLRFLNVLAGILVAVFLLAVLYQHLTA